jgi:hypothetical protein
MWDFPATRRGDFRVPVELCGNKERVNLGSSETFLKERDL